MSWVELNQKVIVFAEWHYRDIIIEDAELTVLHFCIGAFKRQG
jgi:hypothetical protein